METLILGTAIMILALVLFALALIMRDKSLTSDECENGREHHATCANCTCGKVFEKRKALQKKRKTDQ